MAAIRGNHSAAGQRTVYETETGENGHRHVYVFAG